MTKLVDAGFRNRIVDTGIADPDEIMPNPLNWRAHPGMQRAALMGVLSEVGWVQDVIVNRTTGHLLDGHLRVDLARSKREMVPVKYVELTEDEEKLVLATLDPLAALATTDEDALRELLAQVSTSDESLAELLARMGAEAPGKNNGLVEGEDYDAPIIGFVVEVTVTQPSDRDRVSEAIVNLGLTPHVRTVRNTIE